jgi:c-di-GMP-binding flagellar brake protein YcgR
MERRADVREPIRLRVTFKSFRALLSEYTTSISRGGCTLKLPTSLPPDTVFNFELTVEGRETRSIEIEGRVVHSTPRAGGGFDVGITYVPISTPRRVATTRFLDEVFSEKLAKRSHARVPVNIVAEEEGGEGRYLIRDLSRGGMGLRLGAHQPLPEGIALGREVKITVIHDGDQPFLLDGVVVRLDVPASASGRAGIGLQFRNLTEANARLVDALLYLHRPQLVQLRFL